MVKLRENYVKNYANIRDFYAKIRGFYGSVKITGKIRIFYVENTYIGIIPEPS